jgi:hypothetical protein
VGKNFEFGILQELFIEQTPAVGLGCNIPPKHLSKKGPGNTVDLNLKWGRTLPL